MASLGSIFVDLVLRRGSYDEGLNSAANSLTKFQRQANQSLKGVSKSFSEISSSIFSFKGALGTLLGGAGIGAIANSALQAADSIAKLSLQLGLSTDEFQKYQFGAKLSGVETEKFQTAIGFLNNKIAAGDTPYKNTNEAIADLAERMRLAKTSIERTAIATENFGAKSGRVLIPFLINGEKGLKDFGDEAERLGLIFSEKLVKDAENFKDQLEILGLVITKNFQSGLLEGFVGESDAIRDIYTDPAFIDGVKSIGEAFGKLANFAAQTVKAFQDAKLAIAALGIEIASAFDSTIDAEKLQEQLIDVRDHANQIKPASGFGALGVQPSSGFGSNGVSGLIGGPTANELNKRAEAIDKINDSLTKESVLVSTQIQNYGLKDSVIKSALRAKEIEISLSEQGIKLSESERNTLQQKLVLLQENNDKLDDLKEATAIIEDSKTALDKYNESVATLNRLLEENLINQDQFNKGLEKATSEFEENDEATKKMKDSVEELGLTFSSAFEDAVVGGKGFRDVLTGIEQDLLRIGTRELLTEPFLNFFKSQFNQGGGTGGLGGLFGGLGGLFGFATGGSFDIGGSGGTDSQLVAFKGTPGENVTITPPGQGARPNQIIYNITTPDANSFMRSQGQLLARTQAALSRSERRNA